MSWTQGIQIREDLPLAFIKVMEKAYFDNYGEHAKLQYISWYEPTTEVHVDFGTGKALRWKMT